MTTTKTMNDRLVELGVLGNQKDKAIQQAGAMQVEHFLQEYEAGRYEPNDKATAQLLYYLTDTQVRDYTLGILNKYDAKHTLDALNFLLDQAPTDTAFINAPACLLASFLYERGDSATALITLTNAQNHYSMAYLLHRVFQAGWPASSFSAMRAEIHPKIVKDIFGKQADEQA